MYKRYWNEWFQNEEIKLVTRFGNLCGPGYHRMINWIVKGWNELTKLDIAKSFQYCGLTSSKIEDYHKVLKDMINTNIVAPSTTIDIQAPDVMLFNDVFLPEDAHEDLNEDDGPIDFDEEDDCGSDVSSIYSDDGEPDMDYASFAAHSCNSSGSTPTTTPRSTPTTTPRSTPSTTPRATISTTPHSTPITTPRSTPPTTPSATISTTPRSTPTTTPRSSPKSTPRSSPNTTTRSTLSNKTNTSQLASNTIETFKTPVTNQSKSKSNSNIIIAPSLKRRNLSPENMQVATNPTEPPKFCRSRRLFEKQQQQLKENKSK
jgi:hypothetical protein